MPEQIRFLCHGAGPTPLKPYAFSFAFRSKVGYCCCWLSFPENGKGKADVESHCQNALKSSSPEQTLERLEMRQEVPWLAASSIATASG